MCVIREKVCKVQSACFLSRRCGICISDILMSMAEWEKRAVPFGLRVEFGLKYRQTGKRRGVKTAEQ